MINPTKILRQVMSFYFLIVVLSSCTGLGKITDEQYLITKNTIQFNEKSKIANFKKINTELSDEIIPKPNGKILWMRPRLAFYNTISESKKQKGLKYWLKNKIGKAPALLDEEICTKLDQTFQNRLYHKGYFNAISEHEILKKKRIAKIIHHVDPKQNYLIDTLLFPKVVDQVTSAIFASKQNSLIKKGTSYNLDLLKSERERIDEELKNKGFYFFDNEYLLFQVDTATGNHNVKLKMIIKSDSPKEAGQIYHFDKILVAEDFRLENYNPDTTQIGNYTILSTSHYMKSKIFLNSVLFDKNDIYSREKHNNSIRQLMGLGAYKFVNIKYGEINQEDSTINALFSLTPSQKMSVSTELNATSKSNNFMGPGLKLSYKSRNFLRGAEVLSVNFNGNFEKQVTGKGAGDTAYEFSVDTNLDIPRTIPFKLKKTNRPFLPTTSINLGGGIFSRVSLYQFNTLNTGLEYNLRKNQYITHVLRPIDISLTNLSNTTPEFEEYLLQNPSIRQSFEEQFIVGLSYNFIINHLVDKSKDQYYMNIGLDPSGNLISLLNQITTGHKTSPENPIIVFGAPVSQYFRIRGDFRYYFKTGKESIIATRLFGGMGVPYGSSSVMPYVKQFYSGGTNSLRAFRARSIGPGIYQSPESVTNFLIDQTGEIKLEANMEYRFPIAKYLKGAFFADTGNIWLVNEDPLRPGGKFDSRKFYKELAIGLGFGLRIDVDVAVLRFDWAFPIRKPWLPEGDRWTFDTFDILNSKWRKENLLWNISIGYPF